MTILSGLIAVFNRLLGRAATATVGWATVLLFGRVPAASIDWRTTAGPFFGNYLGMLRFDGRMATFDLEKPACDGPVSRATPVTDVRLDLTTAQLAEA